MGNNRSRVAPARTFCIIDSQTRTRYQNQRELIQLRRKLVNINIKHNDAMSQLNLNRYEAKLQQHKLKYEQAEKELFEKLDRGNQQVSTSSINESGLSDDRTTLTLERSNLLLHNLNALNEWEKSLIFPNIRYGISNRKKSFNAIQPLRSRYSSKLDFSRNSFEQPELSLLAGSLSLKQHTERMKKTVKVAVAKSVRDSTIAARHNAHSY